MLKAPENTHIFLSYARIDGSVYVDLVCAFLDSKGYQTWKDISKILGGYSWSIDIEKAIDSCDTLIAILTHGSYKSTICRGEHLRALRKRKRVIPLLFNSEADIPVYFEHLNYLDFSSDDKRHEKIKTIINELQEEGHRSFLSIPEKYKKTITSIPPLPEDFIHRPVEFEKLRQELFRDTGVGIVSLTALRGMGGIGKTYLAMALCHNEVVQDAFPDGVIWLKIGDSPGDLLMQMRMIGKTLGDSMEHYDDPESSKAQLRNILYKKAVLIVLDDVWDITPVKIIHETVSYKDSPIKILITTRKIDIIHGLNAKECFLGTLSRDQSIKVLNYWSGNKYDENIESIDKIIERLNGHPLALRLCGSLLRQSMTAEEWLLIYKKISRIKTSHTSKNPDENLTACFKVSVDQLEDNYRQLFYSLGIFPQDIFVPEETIYRLWQEIDNCLSIHDCKYAQHQMKNLSLIESDEQGRVILHDLLNEFTAESLSDNLAETHNKLISATKDENTDWWNAELDGYLFYHIAYHLNFSNRKNELRSLLLDYRWLEKKLNSTDTESLLADFTYFSNDEAISQLWGALKLSQSVLNKDKGQLAIQLKGRLGNSDCTEISIFIQLMEKFRHKPKLIFETCSLIPPDSPLMYTLNGSIVAIDSKGEYLANSNDQTIYLWDLKKIYQGDNRFSFKQLKAIFIKNDKIRALAVVSKGPMIVVGFESGSIMIWQWPSGPLRVLNNHFSTSVIAIRSSEKNSCLIIGFQDGTVAILEIETGEIIFSWQKEYAQVTDIAISHDEQWAVTAHQDKIVRIWDIENGKLRCDKENITPSGDYEFAEELSGVAISQDKKNIYVACHFMIYQWTINTSEQTSFKGDEPYPMMAELHGHKIAIMPNGTDLLSVSEADGNLIIWDLKTGKIKRSLMAHEGYINEALVPLCGDNIIVTSGGGSGGSCIKIWNLKREGGLPPLNFYDDRYPPNFIAVTQDGEYALSIPLANPEIWNLKEDFVVNELVGEVMWNGPIPRYAVSLRNNAVFIAADLHSNTEIKGIFLWELNEKSKPIWLIQRDVNNYCEALAISPDGKILLAIFDLETSENNDAILELWDIDHLHFRQISSKEFKKETYITDISITNNGRYGVIGFRNGSIYRWEIEKNSFYKVKNLSADKRPICITTTWDSQNVISIHNGGEIQGWEIESGKFFMSNNLTYIPISNRPSSISISCFADNQHIAILSKSMGLLEIYNYKSNLRIGGVYTDFSLKSFAINNKENRLTLLDANRRVHRIKVLA